MDQPLKVQLAALSSSDGHRGFAYWMEMGLGKTYTTLLDFQRMVDRGEATRHVVVCPNSFKSGWTAEIEKQEINTDAYIYESGADHTSFFTRKYNRPPTLIVNYEAIRREATQEHILKFIRGRKALLTLDESIQIKTNNSQQTKAAISLANEFAFVRELTGKPQTQGPHDLWGQMRALGIPMKNMNFWVWRNTFCRMGGYLNKKVLGAQNEEYLASIIDPYVFRASKKDWTDLPPKMYTIRDCAMGDSQRRQYNSMEQEFVTWLSSDEVVTVEMALTKYIKLAQIQFGFIIDENQKIHELVEPEKNPRLVALHDILEEIPGKLVVVYHHKYAGAVLETGLRDYRPAFIRGGMSPDELSEHKHSFNNDPLCRVICIQTIAGKYGHTLVGGEDIVDQCSTMVFAENTWSLDTRSQLEDRIHRHGQKGESCLYIDLVGSPLDRRIARALQSKEDIFQAVMRHIGKGQ